MPDKITYPDYPSMYVPTPLLQNRRQYFISAKQKKLKYAGVYSPSYLPFTKDEFTNMIDYFMISRSKDNFTTLRLFFAVDDDSSLTIVFVPISKDAKEKEYYYLDPNEDFNFERLDSATALVWIFTNYQSNALPSLEGTYAHDANSIDPLTGKYSDTKSIDYDLGKLKEIVDEMSYQISSNHINISGVRLIFSSYTDNDVLGKFDSKPTIIPKRLVTQFVLTQNIDGDDEIFFIDSTSEWGQRHPHKAKNNFLNFDTGNLCPPICQP